MMRKKDHINVRQLMKVNGWICLLCPCHTWTKVDMVTGMKEVGLSTPLAQPAIHVIEMGLFTSVMARMPSQSLICPDSGQPIFHVRKIINSADKIVVAVPIKKMLAFSSPELVGWSLTLAA